MVNGREKLGYSFAGDFVSLIPRQCFQGFIDVNYDVVDGLLLVVENDFIDREPLFHFGNQRAILFFAFEQAGFGLFLLGDFGADDGQADNFAKVVFDRTVVVLVVNQNAVFDKVAINRERFTKKRAVVVGFRLRPVFGIRDLIEQIHAFGDLDVVVIEHRHFVVAVVK